MVYFLSNLHVADNSGARLVQCLKILGASNRNVARPGDIVIVVVKRAEPNHKKMSRGKICRALIVRLVYVIIDHLVFGLILSRMLLCL